MADLDTVIETGLPDPIAAAVGRRVGLQLPIETSGKTLKLNFATLDDVLRRELATNPAMKDLPAISPAQRDALAAKIQKDYGSVSVPLACDPTAPPPNPDAEYRYSMVTPDKFADMSSDPRRRLETHAKWSALKCAIETSGGAVDVMKAGGPTEGGPREMFSRDRYFMLGDTAYLPDIKKYEELTGGVKEGPFGSKVYGREIDQMRDFLEDKGVKTKTVEGAWFEGGNLVKNDASKTIFMGLEKSWDNTDSSRRLIEAINQTQPKKWDMMGVPLVNEEHMFHLDLGMSQQLPHGEHVLSPYVTDPETFKAIQNRIGEKNTILIKDQNDDAYYSANLAVASKTNLVMSYASETLQNDLKQRGYKPVMPEEFGQGNFMTATGGPDCQTNSLPPAKGLSVTR